MVLHSEQTFGNVEPALSLDKVRKIELDADKREAAAIRIQAYERGRQTRSKRHLSAQQPATEETTKDNADTASRRTMGKVVTTREESAATKIQSVQRGRLARGVAARAKADLARYRKEMGRIAHDVDVADRADRAAASTAADAAAATAAAVVADAADANAAEAAAAGQGSEKRP